MTPYPAGMTPTADKDVYSSNFDNTTEDGKYMVFRDVDNKEVRIPSNISIGELSNLITSEDNQHFQEKQEEEMKKIKEKLWWLYDGEDPERKKKLLLMNEEEVKLLEDESVRHSWPHRSQNSLMFLPTLENACSTCKVNPLAIEDQQKQQNKSVKKQVVCPKNTRLRLAKDLESGSNTIRPLPSTKTPLQEIVATPAPEPGVDYEPKMTWGDIENTPLALGDAIVPPDMPMTPLPAINKKEVIANRVYQNMKKCE